MKKLKKYLAVGFSAIMVVTAAGCSGSTTTSSDATGETTSESTNATATTSTKDTSKTETTTDTSTTTGASVVFGKVTAIDGTSITLALGEMQQGNGKGNGETPPTTDGKTAQSSTSTTSTDTTTPSSDGAKSNEAQAPSGNTQGSGQAPTGEKPSGEAPSGEAPSGEAPNGDGQAPDMSAMFKESGETKTITIEDESLIKIMSGSETTTGSLSDIVVDTIIAIQYGDSDTITSITIQSAGK